MKWLIRKMLRHGPGAVIKRRSPKGMPRPYVKFAVLEPVKKSARRPWWYIFRPHFAGLRRSQRRRIVALHPTKGWRFV